MSRRVVIYALFCVGVAGWTSYSILSGYSLFGDSFDSQWDPTGKQHSNTPFHHK